MEIKRIVVATDFSEQSDLAAAHAIHIARHTGAIVIFVHAGTATNQPTPFAPGHRLDARRLERRLLAEQANTYAASGVPVSYMLIDMFVDSGVPKAANTLSADLIIVGTRGRTGLKRWLLGSVSEQVVRRASACVFVARGGAGTEGGYRRILVPTDFSEPADRALDTALQLVAPSGRIDLFHAWHLPGEVAGYRGLLSATDPLSDPICRGFVESAIELGKARVERARERHPHVGFIYREGSAAARIMSQLEARRYDVVVMGSQGRRGIGRWLLGSVAETIVRHAPCSVLVAHARERVAPVRAKSRLDASEHRATEDGPGKAVTTL